MPNKKRKKRRSPNTPTAEEIHEQQYRREMERIKKLQGGTHEPGREPGRNEPCPCGSEKKYKRCCIGEAAQHFLIVDPQTSEPWAPEDKIVVFPSMQSAQRWAFMLQRPARAAGIGVSKWQSFKDQFTGPDGVKGYIHYEEWKAIQEENAKKKQHLSPESLFAKQMMRQA